MLVYAIVCMDRKTLETTISTECYKDWRDAVKFIETRSGNPVKINDWRYDADDIIYLIKVLGVK